MKKFFTMVSLFFTATVLGQNIDFQQTFESTDPLDLAFGGSIAIDGDVLVIGSESADRFGAVYVYELQNGNWTVVTKLEGSDINSAVQFGYSLDIENDVIVVGTNSGAGVYIFEKPTSGWQNATTETVKITSGASGFGKAVSLNGNELLIGSPDEQLTGVAYVYSKLPTASWTTGSQTAMLTHPVATGNELGIEVSLANDYAAIGVLSGGNAGNVLIYERGSGYTNTGSAHAILRKSNRTLGDNFGTAIETQDNRIIVGTRATAAVYIYNRPAIGWAAEYAANGTLEESYSIFEFLPTASRFGETLAINGDLLLVGAKFYNGTFNVQGTSYLYNLGLNQETLISQIDSPNPVANGAHGYAVSISSGNIFVGEYHTNNGMVHYYQLSYVEDINRTICFGESFIFGNQTLTASGSYSELFTSSIGVDSTVNLTLTVNSQILGNAIYNDPSCFGSLDGEVGVTGISGGTAPYGFNINGGSFAATNTFTGLAEGSYVVKMRDAVGCERTFNFQINDPDQITATATGSDLQCYNGGDGILNVLTSGGTPTYSYSIDGSNFQTSATFSGLDAGSYDVLVRDVNGCEITTNTVLLNQPPMLDFNASKSDISCFGENDGEVVLSGASGGNGGPYKYSVDGINFQAIGTFSGVGAGNITVYAQDVNGCIFSKGISISEPSEIIPAPLSVPTTTCGGADGAIEVSLSGGSGPFQFSLNGGAFQFSNLFTGLSAGSYTINIKDNNDCEKSTVVVVDDPTQFTLSTEVINISCNGANDAQVTIFADPSGAGYEYSLDGSNFQASPIFSNLTAGNYTCTVKNSVPCTNTITFNISEPSIIIASPVVTDILCNGENAGEIEINVSGGTAPYQFSLNEGGYQNSNVFSDLGEGSYRIVVQDANSCLTDLSTTVTQPNKITTTTTVINNECYGDSNGKISISVSGGTSPYEYSLDGSIFQTSNEFTSLAAGSYKLYVKDSNGCNVEVSTIITQPDVLLAEATITNNFCANETEGEISISVSGGTSPYSYSLDEVQFQSNSAFGELGAGTYTVTVQDANECVTAVNAVIAEPTTLTLSASFDGSQVNLTAAGGTAPYEFSQDGTNFQTSATFVLANGQYNFTALDANGCGAETSSVVVITALDSNFSDNAFLVYPNPINDFINVTEVEANSRLRLFDSNGSIVFEKVSFEGSAQIDTNFLNAGIYILEISNKEFSRKIRVIKK